MKTAHQKVRNGPILRNPTGPSHRLLPSSFPGLLRSPAPAQNPIKIGQKAVYFHECEFFSCSASITCNFAPSKQTDFPATTPNLPLTPDRGQVCLLASLPLCAFALSPRPKLNKTERFRTELPGHTGQNRIKPNKTEWKCGPPSQTMPTLFAHSRLCCSVVRFRARSWLLGK